MKHTIKILFLFYIIVLFIQYENVDAKVTFILLSIISINVFKEKYFNNNLISFLSIILIILGIYFDKRFFILLCIPIYDFMLAGNLILSAIVFFMIILLCIEKNQPTFIILVSVICAWAGHILHNIIEKKDQFKKSLDSERNIRYELEKAKLQLLKSSKETTRFAIVNERNRIAREIHDNVGHSLARILIQLQAAVKVKDRDDKKSELMLNNSIKELSNTLILVRETVYDLKPDEKIDIAYIKELINNFKFCEINFNHKGDFSSIESEHFEALTINIKEALTNASKYSIATKIDIELTTNSKITRLYIKDNGIGCEKLSYGFGLKGIKERIYSYGGSVSITGHDGFMIVCIIPKEEWKI